VSNRKIAQIVLAYALFSVIYIPLSDLLLFQDTGGPDPETLASIAKGLVFVLLSSLLIGVMLRHERDASAVKYTAVFRHAIQEAPYPILLHAEDGAVLKANRSWSEISGYDIEHLPTLSDWIKQAYAGPAADLVPLVAETYGLTAHKHYGDFTIRCKDGSERIWSVDSVGVGKDATGRRLAMTMAKDVTERRRAEADLLASHARVHRVLDHIPDLVFTNRQDRVSYINPAGAKLLGYARPEDCIGLSIYLLFDPALHEVIAQRIIHLRSHPGSRAPILLEQMVTSDGSHLTMEVSAVSYQNDGEVEIEVVGRDVRDRLQVEKTRLEAQAQFAAIAEQSVAGIFALSQDAELTYANPKVAAILGRPQVDLVGTSVASLVAAEELPVVLRGLERCFAGDWTTLHHEFHCLRQDGSTVLVHAHATLATVGGQRVLLGVLNDITDRRQVEATIQEYIARLEGAVLGTASAVAQMVELRDPYTAGHERRVGELAAAIAAEMGLDAHVQRGLKVAGAVHDVGKIKVPAEILSKPGKLSAIEYALIQQHAGHSYDVLKNVDFPWPIAEMVWQHHERLDGSGYPRGLKGDEILLEGSILAVADIVESMSSHRPYRPALGLPAALAEIEATAGTKLHPDVVAACLRLFREQHYQIPA